MTLEEKIALMLQEEAAELDEAKKCSKMEADEEECDDEDDEAVDMSPKMKDKEKVAEETSETEEVSVPVAEQKQTVSAQVSALLSAEGLSEDFRTQAVAIFEAAVADRVLQIEESLKSEYDQKLNEAKEELAKTVDGYLSESVLTWANENKVPLVHSFKADLAESFIDGLRQLFVEHNVVVPEESEEALNIALELNTQLEEELMAQKTAAVQLQEEINVMKRDAILESVKSTMTQTEADRFSSLVEAIEYVSEEQYKKQLQVVKENFSVTSSTKVEEKAPIVETTVKNVDPLVEHYASYFNKNK